MTGAHVFRLCSNRAVSVTLAVTLALLATPVAAIQATPDRSAPTVRVDVTQVTGADLNAVDFVDDSLGFAVGEQSTILRTKDGGVSWSVLQTGGALDLRAVSFLSADAGLAVSSGGVVLETTDGGDTWITATDDLAGELYVAEQVGDIAYLTASEAVAVGGAQDTPPVVWRSFAAGAGWTTEFSAGTYPPPDNMPPFPLLGLGVFHAVDFLVADRGWAVGHDVYVDATLNPEGDLPVVFDYDASRTGEKWRVQSIAGTGALYDVSFSDLTHGIAVGAAGAVYRTEDAGTTWIAEDSGVSEDLLGVSLAPGGHAWAVGTAGTVCRTTDGGRTWERAVPPTTGDLDSVAWIGGDEAVAVGDGGVIVRVSQLDWSGTEPPPVDGPVEYVAVEGLNRYETAVEASKIAFPQGLVAGPDGHKTVIVASGAAWPDALAASGLAGAHVGPLLLTLPSELPAVVEQEILRLGADRAVVVGGTGAVGQEVVSRLAQLLGGVDRVTRLGGLDRYETARIIAQSTVSLTGRPAWDGTAFVATGANFPDALAAAPLATAGALPLLLAEPAGISAANVAFMRNLGVKRVIVLGGTGAVSSASEAALVAAFGDPSVDRVAGSDRYATAAAVAESGTSMGLDWASPALATGADYPDALAGGVMQGLTGSVLLLTPTDALSDSAKAALVEHADVITELRFLGGTGVIAPSVRDAVKTVLDG